jgi:hypothetical protein
MVSRVQIEILTYLSSKYLIFLFYTGLVATRLENCHFDNFSDSYFIAQKIILMTRVSVTLPYVSAYPSDEGNPECLRVPFATIDPVCNVVTVQLLSC